MPDSTVKLKDRPTLPTLSKDYKIPRGRVSERDFRRSKYTPPAKKQRCDRDSDAMEDPNLDRSFSELSSILGDNNGRSPPSHNSTKNSEEITREIDDVISLFNDPRRPAPPPNEFELDEMLDYESVEDDQVTHLDPKDNSVQVQFNYNVISKFLLIPGKDQVQEEVIKYLLVLNYVVRRVLSLVFEKRCDFKEKPYRESETQDFRSHKLASKVDRLAYTRRLSRKPTVTYIYLSSALILCFSHIQTMSILSYFYLYAYFQDPHRVHGTNMYCGFNYNNMSV